MLASGAKTESVTGRRFLMKTLTIFLMLAAAAAPLAGCVVYTQPVRPYAAAHWVPGHYNGYGYWVRGHWA